MVDPAIPSSDREGGISPSDLSMGSAVAFLEHALQPGQLFSDGVSAAEDARGPAQKAGASGSAVGSKALTHSPEPWTEFLLPNASKRAGIL